MSLAKRTRVVILGSGWGAFRLAKTLDPSKFKVNIISPRNHMLFTPMLASASVGTVDYASICEPVRPLMSKHRGVYYEAKATDLDVQNKKVHCQTEDGKEFDVEYDKLAIAVGYQANDFNTPGVLENCMFMKETADSFRLRQHILQTFERASYQHMLDNDPVVSAEEQAEIKRMLTFVIVGGGPTGIELAGELTDFLQKDMARLYPHLKGIPEVHLVTYGVLAMFYKDLQQYALTSLEKRAGVKFHLEAMVGEVTDKSVILKSGVSIPSGMTIWCAGIKATPFARAVGLPKAKNNAQIQVDDYLRVKDHQDIFALGDCAEVEGTWHPQTAQVAKQQAVYLGKMLNTNEAVEDWKKFQFNSLGVMAYLGGQRAVLQHHSPVWQIIRNITPQFIMNNLGGFTAFLAWRGAYWSMQLSMRNRYLIFMDWACTAIFGRDVTRHGRQSRPM